MAHTAQKERESNTRSEHGRLLSGKQDQTARTALVTEDAKSRARKAYAVDETGPGNGETAKNVQMQIGETWGEDESRLEG